MEDGRGGWCSDLESIAEKAIEYFEDFFASNKPVNPYTQLEGMSRKVTNAMNRNLTRPVSKNEVKRAVFSINPFSAPSDDGFNAKFYQFYSEIVKNDVVRAVRSVFC